MVPQGTPTAEPVAELLLDNQLCFLLYRLQRGMTDVYRPLLAELGLTYPQYLVMLVLWQSDGATVGQLGQRLHLDSGTLSPLLKRMEQADLLRRSRLASDERVVAVNLTPAGRKLQQRASGVPAAIGRCLGLDAESYRRFHAMLTELAGRMPDPSQR